MSPLIRFCIAICICSFASGQASAAPQTAGYFCANCVDFDSAQQQAIQYAAPLECNSDEVLIDPDSDLECSSEDRRVVLGNHLTGQVFAFLVSRGNEFPWPTTADAVSLNSTEIAVYEGILDLRVDWENALEGGMTIQPEQGVQDEGEICPAGTAIDYLTRPGGQAQLKDMITADVTANIEDYQDQSPWYSSGFGVGLTVLGTGGNLQFPEGGDEGESIYSIEFPISEIDDPPFLDVLVYQLELVGTGESGQAVLEIDFLQNASRAAGARLDELFAGNVEITDDCVLDKLGRLDDIGNSEISLGGSPLDSNNTFGTGGSSGGASGGSTSKMCIFDFFVNGVYQYSFRAPCDSAKDKEEISE